MTQITIEIDRDALLAAGFVPFAYWGRDYTSGTDKALTHETYLVHGSVADRVRGYGLDQATEPVLMPYHNHWEAKWGAQYFRLRTYQELHGFMTLFNYPLS